MCKCWVLFYPNVLKENSQHINEMTTDIKPDYITVMALLFVMIQRRCSDTLFYHRADNVSESSEAQFSFHSQWSVTREVSASSFPWQMHWTNAGLQGNGSPRASGSPDAGVHLPCVVRERHQMGWGFPVTSDLLYLHVCTGSWFLSQIYLVHFGLCPSQTRHTEAEKKSGPARLKATLCPWALKKLQQQGRETV